MRLFGWAILLLIVLAGWAGFQWLSNAQDHDRFRQDIEAGLRENFTAGDRQLRQEIARLASLHEIDPATVVVELHRSTRAGAGPVSGLVGNAFPGQQTRYLEATVRYRRDILIITQDYELKATVWRISTPHPQQGPINEALRSLPVPGR